MNRYDKNATTTTIASEATAPGTRKLRRNGGEGRSRMSLTVDAGLRSLMEAAKRASGHQTSSKAIRWALRRALAPPPPHVALGFRILQWAEGLKFASERERRELRKLAHELYEQIKQTVH